MSKYPKAKMPDYGDGPEPCEDCAIKDKRIAELEADKENLLEHIGRMRQEWELRTEAMRQQLFKFAELQPPTPIIIVSEGGEDE